VLAIAGFMCFKKLAVRPPIKTRCERRPSIIQKLAIGIHIFFISQAANVSWKDRFLDSKHANQINLQRRQLQAELVVMQLL